MTAHETQNLRALLVQDGSVDQSDSSAFRLLDGLGHDVTSMSSDDVVSHMRDGSADLVVVDAGTTGDHANGLLQQLSHLPVSHQPRQVVVLSDRMSESLEALRMRRSNPRVHVFLKPLHLHGLLGLIRQLENEEPQALGA